MILLNSCSIIDDHAYPEKKKNFLLQHKNKYTENNTKFQHHISHPIRS